MIKIKPLAIEFLSTRCDPKQFKFSTTAELSELTEPVGQDRAMSAIDFGVHIQQNGFNLYLLGPEGTGKHSLIKTVLNTQAVHEPTPDDWCYVNNFSSPNKPIALRLPAGLGPTLQKDMENLIEELGVGIPAIFDSSEFRSKIQALEEELKTKQDNWLKQLHDKAKQKGLAIITTSQGFAVSPVQDGKILTIKEFNEWPDEERQQTEKKIAEIRHDLSEMLVQIAHWHTEKKSHQKKIQREFTLVVVDRLIVSLKAKYHSLEQVQNYLQAVEADIIENAHEFLQTMEKTVDSKLFLIAYQVNVLVTHPPGAGAPVIFEDHPNHANLIGRTEYMSQYGALTTNFTLIRPGCLHLANGGYLILDAVQVLAQPYSWDSLKRTLYAQKITLESLNQVLGFPSTLTLEPEAIPIKIKVILLGERSLYYFLCEHDPNFADLFKVAADFSNHIPRNKNNFLIFARLLATISKQENLLPLNRHAVAKMIDHSSRLANDTQRLFTNMRCLVYLLHEANYWAKQAGRSLIKAADIEHAIHEQIYRANRIKTRIHEDFNRNLLLITTKGKKIGQVNGLSVIQLGNYSFGLPSKITATARLGKGEVVDIEREVELGGALHSKGVLILSGFLSGRYLVDHHLSIAASLVFEQNYGEVEGDSASVAELAALLSAIGHLPIFQSLAITGSINQYGVVQPIGNVNEKIEGFFEVCQTKGLNGDQGVIIPQSNVQHLMLNKEVLSAVKKRKFSVYAVEDIDEVMTLLTGLPAGKRTKKGFYLENTVNGRIERSLLKYAIRSEEDHKSDRERDSEQK